METVLLTEIIKEFSLEVSQEGDNEAGYEQKYVSPDKIKISSKLEKLCNS